MMTYEESAALMTDIPFRGRVKVAVLRYADRILIEPSATAGYNTLLRWAQQAFQQPDMVAGQVQPPTVMDAAVQSAGGADITDEALQAAVETTVRKML